MSEIFVVQSTAWFRFIRRRELSVGVLLVTLASLCQAQELPEGYDKAAAAYFKQNCTSCHTIGGGRLTGPDLKHVMVRKDREWLMRFIQDPKAMIDQGDVYALKLKQEAGGVLMPTAPGMTRQTAGALMDLIAMESEFEKSHFAGSQIPDRPFTPEDVTRGQAIFIGALALQNRGPSCISCHAVKDIGALGGGKLGPDLTRVYERLQGREKLAAWLMAPATPTMQKVFADQSLTTDEVLTLTAFFNASVQKKGVQSDSVAQLSFFLFGLGGAFAGLVFFDQAWRRRLRGVRRLLVHGNDTRDTT